MEAVTLADTRVAICVCTHSRSEALSRLLVQLQDIDLRGYNPEWIELVVVDNNPNSETRHVCSMAAPRLPISLHYTEEPRAGISYARNHAVKVALERGADFVAFIDDDDIPQQDWLIRLLDRQVVTRADLVFGTWMLDAEMPEWLRSSGIFRSPDRSKPKVKAKGGRYGLPQSASTCNILAGREILERVGAKGPIFSHAFCYSGGEDKDFFIRAREMGAKLSSANNSVVHRIHEPERYTVSGLLKRGFKNGCSQTNMARYHGDRWRLPQLVATAFGKLVLSMIIMPFTIFSRRMFHHYLYRIAKCTGVIYTAVTGKSVKYYADS